MSSEAVLLRSAKLPEAQHVIQRTTVQALKTADTAELVHMTAPVPSSSRRKPSDGATERESAARARKAKPKTGTIQSAARNLPMARPERKHQARKMALVSTRTPGEPPTSDQRARATGGLVHTIW